MNFLILLIAIQSISLSIAMNGSFIDEYLSPLIRPFCSEVQERLKFKYSLRVRKVKNINSHAVYLFTEDKVFSIPMMTAALNIKENFSYVIPEIFFNAVQVKELTEFWDGRLPNHTFNSIFSDPIVYDTYYWLFGDQYLPISINIDEFKVTQVQEPMEFSKSHFLFLNNQKIAAKGLTNIFGVDIADAGDFRPVRVYVRDLENEGKAISFAFYNISETTEEFENGKHYTYSFNTAAFLVSATSLAIKPKIEHYIHYFELRTRIGKFSLFDFTYNRDFLLVGTNEELLGCPPSFCHSREFDDIIRLHDGTKLLVYHEWVWNFNKPGEKIEWEEAVISNMSSRQHISRQKNFPQPFKFGIRRIVDGSFIDESILYIFRNGSFISSNDDTIVRNNTSFDSYTRIDQVFKGVPSQTYDALFYHKESRTVFFIKEDKFWGYSMANKALTSEDFPKHIENLGLPYDLRVTSTYVEEDDSGKQIQFYLFTENRYIVFKENEFKGNRFQPRRHTYYCTSVTFFGCSEGQFVCPELETKSPNINEETNVWLIVIILIIIVVVLLAIVVIIIFYVFVAKKSDKKTDLNMSKNNGSGKKLQSNGSGQIKENAQQIGSSVSEGSFSTRSKV